MFKRIILVSVALIFLFTNICYAENIINEMYTESTMAQLDLLEALQNNPNLGYETRCIAISKMITLMTEGRIGSYSELWLIASAFGFQYDNNLSLNENADKLFAFLSIRQKWYEADNYESLATFLSAMSTAVGSNKELAKMNVVWNYKDENLEFAFDNEDIPLIVNTLAKTNELQGITEAEFFDLLTQMAQFHEFAW